MIGIDKIIVFLIFGINLIHTKDLIDKDGYCTQTNISVKSTNGTAAQEKKYCCRHYEEKNKTCIECKLGYASNNGEPCQRCKPGTYGKKCAFICNCKDSNRCDNVRGCSKGAITTSDIKKEAAEMVAGKNQKSKDVSVVIYMTCVAAFGLIIVGSIIFWKYRKALFQLMSSWKNRHSFFVIRGNPQQVQFDIEDNDRSSKFGQESIYDVINEKKMISFGKKI